MALTPKDWLSLVAEFRAQKRTLGFFARERNVDRKQLLHWLKWVKAQDEEPQGDPLDEILVKTARQDGYLTISQVATDCAVPERLAERWLNRLVEQGRLLALHDAVGVRYYAL